MRNLVTVFLCTMMGLSVNTVWAHADAIDVSSQITGVTVFSDRAEITRSTQIKLAPGVSSVALSNLPPGIEANSLTAKATGNMDIVIHGVRLEVQQLAESQDARVKELEQQLRGLNGEMQALNDRVTVLKQQRVFLDSIQAASGEQISKDLRTEMPSVETVSGLTQYLGEALSHSYEQERIAKEQTEDIRLKQDQVRRQLSELSRTRSKQRNLVLVDVEALESGTATLEVTYRMRGAQWWPVYAVRAESQSRTVEWVSYAMVSQRTGEDWQGVDLQVSTAQPQFMGSMPEVNPWFLQPYSMAPPSPKRALMGQLSKGMAMEAIAEESVDYFDGNLREKEAKLSQAVVVQQGPSVVYQLPKAETVISDGQQYKLPIQTQTYDAEWLYVTAPAFSEKAYIRASMMQADGAFLLPGEAAIFLDGDFMANSYLDQVSPGEKFDVDLGVDARVKVVRKTLNRSEAVSVFPGFRGKTKTAEQSYLTTVENYTGQPIQIEVYERLPVAQREEITVDDIVQLPKTVEADPEKPGVFVWKTSVDVGEKQEFKLSYRIRHPVDMNVPY